MERLCSEIGTEARALGLSYLSRGSLDLGYMYRPGHARAQELQFPYQPAGGSKTMKNALPWDLHSPVGGTISISAFPCLKKSSAPVRATSTQEESPTA